MVGTSLGPYNIIERLLLVRYEDAGLEDHYFNIIPNLPALLGRER